MVRVSSFGDTRAFCRPGIRRLSHGFECVEWPDFLYLCPRLQTVFLMKSPFLQNLNELPGPVWLFGAYGMTRLGEWSFALLMQCVNGNLRLDGLTAGMQLLGLAGALLPVALLCSLAAAQILWAASGPLVCRFAGAGARCGRDCPVGCRL